MQLTLLFPPEPLCLDSYHQKSFMVGLQTNIQKETHLVNHEFPQVCCKFIFVYSIDPSYFCTIFAVLHLTIF